MEISTRIYVYFWIFLSYIYKNIPSIWFGKLIRLRRQAGTFLIGVSSSIDPEKLERQTAKKISRKI